MSATEIFLVTDIECLSQRFRADTCNICRRGSNTHATFLCPRCISIPHNNGHGSDSHLKKIGWRGNSAMSEGKKTSAIADFFYWVLISLTILNILYTCIVTLFQTVKNYSLLYWWMDHFFKFERENLMYQMVYKKTETTFLEKNTFFSFSIASFVQFRWQIRKYCFEH
jgi:hypothetical protein